MNKDAKIYVAGHRGMAGSGIVRSLNAKGFQNLVLRTRAELDLLDARAVKGFFAAERFFVRKDRPVLEEVFLP